MPTLINTVVASQKKSQSLVLDTLLILGGSLFIALMAQVAIPLGFSPIPLTLQSLAILIVGGLLGSKKGALAVITYIAEGATGLPFYAGGASGLAKLFGPSLGYFIGFVVAAYMVGFLLERGWKRRFWLTFDAMIFGSILILVSGALYLSFFVGAEKALIMGVYPFLIGDLLKVFVASTLIPSGYKLIRFLKK